jgi:hypothetical protein
MTGEAKENIYDAITVVLGTLEHELCRARQQQNSARHREGAKLRYVE